jgi:FkbM family methyltransferase
MGFTASSFERDLRQIVKTPPFEVVPLDLFMCYRLLLGRLPEWGNYDEFAKHTSIESMDGMVGGVLRSEECRKRWGTESLELPEVPVMAELNGLRLWFYLSDRIVGWGAITGTYEADLVAAIRGAIRPGTTCCDVGANLGYFALLMAQLGANVYAFEPFPKNLSLLDRNVRDNQLPGKIFVHPVAASEAARKTLLCVDEQDSNYVGGFVPHNPEASRGFRSFEIQSRRIDDVVPASVRIDCVKMDIEGSEPMALRGMERILRHDRPAVFFEFNPFAIEKHAGEPPQKIVHWLTSLGYRITHLDGTSWSYSYELKNLVARPA